MKYFFLILILCVGCSTCEDYIAADRATYDVLAPEYREYVESDDNLDDDQKQRRLRLLESWESRVESGESYYQEE